MAATKSIFIVAAKRTPFGAFGGALKSLSATDLAVESTTAALSAGNVDPSLVDAVFVGNVAQTSRDAAYLARHVGLRAGCPEAAPALVVNRLCGSGFEAVALGAEKIESGRADITVCGGTESMSQAPLSAFGHKVRYGVDLGKGLQLEDTLWNGLTDSLSGLPMGMTAENLAEKYNISREDVDEFAARSQSLAGEAHEAGRFTAEIAPMELKTRKGSVTFDKDEHPRPSTTSADLAKLRPVFKKDGVVTAGGASGICDGAATLVLAGEEAVAKHNLTPLVRLVSWHAVGCDPAIMGIGPVPAIQGALSSAGLTLNDMSLIEINEAFAAQFIGCERALDLDRSICNTNGGAIALGHPLGASGARITSHLTHELVRTKGRYAVGSACIGGGMGIAVVLENMML